MGYMAITNLIGAAVYATRVTLLSARKDRQPLIIPDPRETFPFQIRHIWLQSPDLPCSGHHRRLVTPKRTFARLSCYEQHCICLLVFFEIVASVGELLGLFLVRLQCYTIQSTFLTAKPDIYTNHA
jgi:hypothetical protein